MTATILLFCAAVAFAQEFPVAGIVVNRVTNAPLPRTRLTLTPAKPGGAQTTTSDDTGRFRFAPVPAGKYHLQAERTGYAAQNYLQRTLYQRYFTSIVTGPEEATDELRFGMIPGGVIAGQLVDDRGDPVVGMQVTSARIMGSGDKRRARLSLRATTDDRGFFRIHSLAEGDYILAAAAADWRGVKTDEPQPRAYPVTFYPGTTKPDGAGLVRVQPGKEVRADIAIRPVAGVHAILAAPSRELTIGLAVKGPLGSSFYLGTARYPSRGQAAEDVPAGQYVVTLWENTSLRDFRMVNIDTEGTRVELGQTPLPRLTVQLQATNIPSGKNVYVLMEDLDMDRGWRQLVSNGRAVFPALSPGRYQISVMQDAPLAIRSIQAEGLRLTGDIFHVTSGGAAEPKATVVLDGAVATVQGRLLRAGRKEPGSLVLLVPATAWQNTVHYRIDQTDSDGSFSWRGVAPGEYRMFVFTNGEPDDYFDAEVIRKLLPQGTPLTVTGAPTQEVKFEVAAAGTKP